MTKKILMGASVLALIFALPAFAETKVEAKSETRVKAEENLEKAGTAIERTTEKAGAAVKDAYTDVKAYFGDDDDVKAVTSVNVTGRLTADELLGADVQNAKSEKLGTIQDILVDSEGDAEHVVVKMDGKSMMFDYDVVEGLNSQENILVKISDAEMKKATAYTDVPAKLYSVEKILDADVVDPEGKKIADVDTIAFDDDDADYIIVTFDKVLGLGGDKVALNMEALELVNKDGDYSFRLNAQQTAQFTSYKNSTKAN